VQLTALVEDLKSTGVPATEFQALEELLAELQPLLANIGLAEAEIGHLWTRAEKVLRRFSTGNSGLTGGSPREAFWK
jgi:hypothetical protein